MRRGGCVPRGTLELPLRIRIGGLGSRLHSSQPGHHNSQLNPAKPINKRTNESTPQKNEICRNPGEIPALSTSFRAEMDARAASITPPAAPNASCVDSLGYAPGMSGPVVEGVCASEGGRAYGGGVEMLVLLLLVLK